MERLPETTESLMLTEVNVGKLSVILPNNLISTHQIKSS